MSSLNITSAKFSAAATLASVTLKCSFFTAPDSQPSQVTPQFYIHQTMDATGQAIIGNWVPVNPKTSDGSPYQFPIAAGAQTDVAFAFDLPAGTYEEIRCILFAGGGYTTELYDNKNLPAFPSLALTVTSDTAQVIKPTLIIAPGYTSVQPTPVDEVTFRFAFEIRFPVKYAASDVFSVMAKSVRAYGQTLNIPISQASTVGTGPGAYKSLPGYVDVPSHGPGLYNFQFGLFGRDMQGEALFWAFIYLTKHDSKGESPEKISPAIHFVSGELALCRCSLSAFTRRSSSVLGIVRMCLRVFSKFWYSADFTGIAS